MSTITEQWGDFLVDNSCDSIQLPDTVFLRYYNNGRDELIDTITKEKEDYFYDFIETTTVIGQNEYVLSKRGDVAEDGVTILDGFNKVKGVSWKINTTDTDYTVLPAKTMANLDFDVETYDDTANPFYILQDESIFIYPAPKEASKIKFYGIMYPKKLALTDTDTLPDQYTKSILFYVAKRFFTSQKLTNDAVLAENRFSADLIKIGNAMSGRINAPITRTMPNITNLS